MTSRQAVEVGASAEALQLLCLASALARQQLGGFWAQLMFSEEDLE